jgi:MoxR-like ATPase
MKDDSLPLATCVDGLSKAREEISRVIVGQTEAIELSLIALLCEGHILYEGVPGLGKTLLARSLADSLMLSFARVQFTPDLMPTDVLGASMIRQREQGDFDLKFEAGPIFANLVLADEINRASPKTQAALLEAMQERAVTVRGESYPLPRPFLVLATQNPLEMEGTYPLPEAQIDRFFFKIKVFQPNKDELMKIIERNSGASEPRAVPVMREADIIALQRAVRDIVVPPQLTELASLIVLATQPERPDSSPRVRKYVRYGCGPRGAQALIMAAKARALTQHRLNASLDDLEAIMLPALRHRLALNFEGQSEGLDPESLLAEAVKSAKAGFDFGDLVK